jgi:hypothetical protein
MNQNTVIIKTSLTTPRAAAIAGIIFSVLLLTSLVLIRISVPANPQDAGEWLSSSWKTVNLALNRLPFAGISFLWFIGVVRDRLGSNEDRFFATVFLGCGLLFLLLSIGFLYWAPLVFPLSVLLISVHILWENIGKPKGNLTTTALS